MGRASGGRGGRPEIIIFPSAFVVALCRRSTSRPCNQCSIAGQRVLSARMSVLSLAGCILVRLWASSRALVSSLAGVVLDAHACSIMSLARVSVYFLPACVQWAFAATCAFDPWQEVFFMAQHANERSFPGRVVPYASFALQGVLAADRRFSG